MRVLIMFFCLGLLVATGAAQRQVTPAPVKPRGGQSGSLTPSGLNTDTLNYGDDMKRIYVGDFEHVSFRADSSKFSLMVSSYMTEYSKSCTQYLPKDKVEIVKTVCSNQVATVNQYGQEVDTRRCTQYDKEDTGRYADPRVYALQKTLDSTQTAAIAQAYIKELTQKGDGPGLSQLADIGTYVLQDSSHFLADNGCSSPATMRYQENMLRFGRNEAPIRMAGAAEAVGSLVLAKQQNYRGLVDDLIMDESHAWVANSYLGGSADVRAVQHHDDGTLKEIDANYTLGNRAPGKVRVTLGDDGPPCLYFSDAPANCRIPNPKIMAAFKHNKYADATAPVYPETPPFDDAPGVVDAKRRAFEKTVNDVAAANARRAAGGGSAQSARAAELARPASQASVASAARSASPVTSGTQFRLTAHTLDPINETNVGSGAVFRASVIRTTGLPDGQVPAGATVYLKVEMEQQSPGSRATNDVYNILLERVDVDGKTIPLQSRPIRLIRRGSSGAPMGPRGDVSAAINVGTVLDFYGAQP